MKQNSHDGLFQSVIKGRTQLSHKEATLLISTLKFMSKICLDKKSLKKEEREDREQ